MASGELHRFFDAVRKTEAWAVDTLTRLGTQETPQSAAHAESLIAKHVEKLAEIDGRQVFISTDCVNIDGNNNNIFNSTDNTNISSNNNIFILINQC